MLKQLGTGTAKNFEQVRTEVRVEGTLVYPPGEVGGNIPAQQIIL